MQQTTRRLAAILFTDIVGSTSIMQQDEQKALIISKRYVDVLRQTVSSHGGEILNDYGDGSLCIFSSATAAMLCAVEMQQQLQEEPKVPLRIGLHVGEIFFEDGKVFGDGVNVASRVQSLGIANSILFSSEIHNKVRNQQEFTCVSIGKFHFKNVDEPMEVFALSNAGLTIPQKKQMEGKLKEKKNSRKNLVIIVSIILFLIAAFFLYRSFHGETNGIKSIAVLPFLNGSSDKENEYLGDGIAQEILSNISKISSLEVKGWQSSVSFKNSNKSLQEKAGALGAEYIISGSIQKEEQKVLIRVELTDAATGKIIWSDEYNRQWGDILNIQTEVAQKIANTLNTKLTTEEKSNLSKHYTENVEAYNYYRKGRLFWSAQGPANFDSAEANYKMAIQLDPSYALAYAGLADCYDVNYKAIPQKVYIPIAKAYVAKALSLDSNLSEALTTLGWIQQNFDYNWTESKKNLKKAVDLDPNNSIGHSYYGLVLMHSTPDKETALSEFKKAVDLDPLSFATNWILGRNYYFAGKYDLAIEQFKKTASFTNTAQQYVPSWSLGLVYLKQHLYSQAKNIFDQLPAGNGMQLDNYQVMQSYAYAVMGDKSKAKALLEETINKYPNLSHYRNSQVYVALGDFNNAIAQLELGYEKRDTHMFWIKVDPEFDPIRNEPSFKALLKKMNLE